MYDADWLLQVKYFRYSWGNLPGTDTGSSNAKPRYFASLKSPKGTESQVDAVSILGDLSHVYLTYGILICWNVNKLEKWVDLRSSSRFDQDRRRCAARTILALVPNSLAQVILYTTYPNLNLTTLKNTQHFVVL